VTVRAGRLRILALGCLLAVPARAQEAPGAHPPADPVHLRPKLAADGPRYYGGDELRDLPGLFLDDVKGVVSAPARWDGPQWGAAALFGLGVVAAGIALDQPLDDAVLRNRRPSWDRAAKNLQQLGGTGGLVLLGAGYLGCSWLGDDPGRALWVDAGMATLLARGVVTIPVKFLAGRYRPDQERGAGRFRPFSSGDSFPSGHAAQAFAIASVVSLRCDNPWIGAAAYGLAGLVGLSRLEQREHFTSDVLAGALIGTFTGRAVVRLNEGQRRGRGLAEFSFQPAWGPGYQGLTFQARF
jgi:hypothetical protein